MTTALSTRLSAADRSLSELNIRLPAQCSGEEALALRLPPPAVEVDLVIDARSVREFDAVAAATIRLCQAETEMVGGRFALLEPVEHPPRSSFRAALGLTSPEQERQAVVAAKRIAGQTDVKSFAARVRTLVAPRARESMADLAGIAAGTLADNALTHAGGATTIAAARIRGTNVEMCVRDLGGVMAENLDARRELVRRIQLPTEVLTARPGAPVGIAWLVAQSLRRGNRDGLLFAAGRGRLLFARGAWQCREARTVDGFAATATLTLA